ncbi:hypothetical protein F4780DRAFT_778457 [Xylariomycetidae sp. FL0641]|nr:hypothetical protein F4780DRAFT_778457 [Xylariomycetidae sp. FL0641]
MSSPEAASTYQRYKEDTTLFTTWLGKAAKACGWKPSAAKKVGTEVGTAEKPAPKKDENKGPRLKGKARKAAKEAAKSQPAQDPTPIASTPVTKYLVTTRDLLHQVDLVVKSATRSGSMPERVHRALQSAIKARQRCATWFEKAQVGTQEAREGHQHFITVLQQALDALPHAKPDPPAVYKHDNLSSASSFEKEVLFMTNAYEALDVEDISDDETSPLAHATDTGPVTKPDNSAQLFELEVDQEIEAAFIAFSFFEDIHRLRSDMKKIWTRYNLGELSLIHATILTSACLEIVRREEEEAYEAYAKAHKRSGKTYKDLSGLIYKADALSRGEEPVHRTPETVGVHIMPAVARGEKMEPIQDPLAEEEKSELPPDPKTLEISPFDEFVLLPTGRTLSKLAGFKDAFKLVGWPLPIPPMRLNYILRPDLLDDPRYKRFEEQDEFIVQVVLDMIVDDELRNFSRSSKVPTEVRQNLEHYTYDFEDPMFATLRGLWTEGTVSTKMVFAAQLLWDIHEINLSRNRRTGLDQMRAAGEKHQEAFRFFIGPGGVLDTEDVRWLPKDSELMMSLYGRITCHLQGSTFPQYKRLRVQTAGNRGDITPPQDSTNMPPHVEAELRAKGWTPPDPGVEETARRIRATKAIKPHEDPAFLYKANPLYGGTVILDVAAMVEEAGVALANHQLSIFGAAHLYNALVQTGACQHRWPAMDRIIELHAGPLFANDIPTAPKEMVARFTYRTGFSATANKRRFLRKEPWSFQATPTSRALREFFASKLTLPRLLHNLGAQAEAQERAAAAAAQKTKEKKPPRSGAVPPAARQPQQQQQLTPRHTLHRLERHVDAVLPALAGLDYVGLTRACRGVLLELRDVIADELGVTYPSLKEHQGDSSDPGLLFVVLDCLVALQHAEQQERGRGGEDEEWWRAAPPFKVAKELFDTEFRHGLGDE